MSQELYVEGPAHSRAQHTVGAESHSPRQLGWLGSALDPEDGVSRGEI